MVHLKRSLFAIPTLGLGLALTAGLCPAPAVAETSAELQQQLDSVSEQLYSLYSAAEQAGNDLATVTSNLNDTKAQIEQTTADIAEEEAQLAAYQDELGELVSTQYKSGGSTSIVTLLLSSGSFTDLISNLHYADKAAQHKQGVITAARELKDSLEQNRQALEEQKSEQEKLVADQQVKTEAAQAAANEAQGYYNQLSDELKEQIAAEEEAARQAAEARAAELAAQQAAQQAAEQQEQQASGGDASGATDSGDTSTTTEEDTSSDTSDEVEQPSHDTGASDDDVDDTPAGGGSNVSPSGPTASASNLVARAQSVIGSGYSYTGYNWTGSTSSSWFTCSGLVDYALGLPSWSNSPESLYGKVAYITTDVSQLQYGDLVFFASGGRWCGHVGIYIGGGEMIDSIPGSGVGYRTLDYIGGFIGGGPIV
ncbi:coiled-coil domain-containing protein [Collinsella tanakaei]|uniref:coiled-coil domain-containing protein n=1 Tax=Collinsella tanakaei TaxID=626935 RepID=UPI00195B7611|nr:NlpC/P60 family protein [Collinsella tanakaei]MBM6868376.1 C40 family peptidase [Collinsella tanakaei]